jgi:hypothetical protein
VIEEIAFLVRVAAALIPLLFLVIVFISATRELTGIIIIAVVAVLLVVVIVLGILILKSLRISRS